MDRPWTPGPWWAVLTDDQPSILYRGLICTVQHSERMIAVATGERGEISGRAALPSEWEANAKLIAAAPEMADSLDPDSLDAVADELEVFVHSARILTLRGIAKRQRAALAKARGETMEPSHG
jgi:hypothetical protein